MGVTSRGIWYPDPEDVPQRADYQTLADSVDTALTALTTWTSYVPTVTGSVSNPGSVTAGGRWIQAGSILDLELDLTIATIGSFSGEYRIGLPSGMTTAASTWTVVGGATVVDATPTARYPMAIISPGAGLGYLLMLNSAGVVATHASPITFASGDKVEGTARLRIQ